MVSTIVELDRKSTRLNSSHVSISYAVFCLKKKKDRLEGIERRNSVARCGATYGWRAHLCPKTCYARRSHSILVSLFRLYLFFFFFLMIRRPPRSPLFPSPPPSR